MTYNGINFLLTGNPEARIVPPVKTFSLINPKGKIQLNEELYDLQEEIESHKKKLVAMYDKIIAQYAIPKMEGEEPVKDQQGKPVYETEDTMENGKTLRQFKMEDREAYERDIKALFETEVTFKSKLSPRLLDGVEQIGQVEYRWLKELDLLKK